MAIKIEGIELEVDYDTYGGSFSRSNPYECADPEIEINAIYVKGVNITDLFDFDTHEEALINQILEDL